MSDAYDRDAAVFACGNGVPLQSPITCNAITSSASATALTSPRECSASALIELLSAIANDLSYEMVFQYQLQSFGRPGDVLLAVSSSGRSPNIIRALEWANEHGMRTIALTGFSGGEARELATVSVHVESANYGIIEDAHQACMHLLAQYVRQSRMTPDAVAAQTF